MLVLIGSEVKKQRKSIRNAKAYKQKLEAQGKKSKKEELQIIRDKIKNLRLEGFANKEIMRMLGITSTTTFERHISYLKKNGLL